MIARWIEYDKQTIRFKRKQEEWNRLWRQVSGFAEDPRMVFAPYRNAKGQPVCQWGVWVKRQLIADESNGLVLYPAQTSFATLDEARIIMAYSGVQARI
jgi:hypothetical protein